MPSPSPTVPPTPASSSTTTTSSGLSSTPANGISSIVGSKAVVSSFQGPPHPGLIVTNGVNNHNNNNNLGGVPPPHHVIHLSHPPNFPNPVNLQNGLATSASSPRLLSASSSPNVPLLLPPNARPPGLGLGGGPVLGGGGIGNNVLSTGGVTPGIKQATLISGVGVSASGAPGGVVTAAMTVNNSSGSGGSPGQTGQQTTVVLATKSMASTTTGSPIPPPSSGPPLPLPPSPMTLQPPPGGGGGPVQFINMNMNNLRPAGGGGALPQQILSASAAGPVVGVKGPGIPPPQRMIINQQMINPRTGHPMTHVHDDESSSKSETESSFECDKNGNNGNDGVPKSDDEEEEKFEQDTKDSSSQDVCPEEEDSSIKNISPSEEEPRENVDVPSSPILTLTSSVVEVEVEKVLTTLSPSQEEEDKDSSIIIISSTSQNPNSSEIKKDEKEENSVKVPEEEVICVEDMDVKKSKKSFPIPFVLPKEERLSPDHHHLEFVGTEKPQENNEVAFQEEEDNFEDLLFPTSPIMCSLPKDEDGDGGRSSSAEENDDNNSVFGALGLTVANATSDIFGDDEDEEDDDEMPSSSRAASAIAIPPPVPVPPPQPQSEDQDDDEMMFTNDPNLYSQFIQYNKTHPVSSTSSSTSTSSTPTIVSTSQQSPYAQASSTPTTPPSFLSSCAFESGAKSQGAQAPPLLSSAPPPQVQVQRQNRWMTTIEADSSPPQTQSRSSVVGFDGGPLLLRPRLPIPVGGLHNHQRNTDMPNILHPNQSSSLPPPGPYRYEAYPPCAFLQASSSTEPGGGRYWPSINNNNTTSSNNNSPNFRPPNMTPQFRPQYYPVGSSSSVSSSYLRPPQSHVGPLPPSGYSVVARIPSSTSTSSNSRYRFPPMDPNYLNSQYHGSVVNVNGKEGGTSSRLVLTPPRPQYRPMVPGGFPYGGGGGIRGGFNRLGFEGNSSSNKSFGYNINNYTNPSSSSSYLRPPSSSPITLQALSGLPPGAQGHLLVKTENGQFQLVRVGVSPQAAAAPPPPTSGTPPTTTPPPIPPHPNNTTNSVSSSSTSVPSSSSSSSSNNTNAPPPTSTNSSQVAGNTVVSSTSTTTTTAPTTPNPLPVAIKTEPTLLPNSSSPATNMRLASLPSNAANSSTSGVVGMASSMSSMPIMPHQQQSLMYSPTPQVVVPPPHPHPQNAYSSSPLSQVSNNAANSVSQMTAETAKLKCKNFLSFLLELSAKQNQQVARNVKALIQGLVDGKVNEVDFSDRLQKEVNSQPQPCLVGFLKRSLPHLRHSLAMNELRIEGIKPPPMSSVSAPPPVSALIPTAARTPNNLSTPVRILPPLGSSSSNERPPYAAPIMNPPVPPSRPSPPYATPSKSPAGGKSKSKANSGSGSPSSLGGGGPSSKSGKLSAKDKEKKVMSTSGYSGDDDINDVAAMGGVNLAEESQKILGSTEFVGTQIRSVRDEPFLHSVPLQTRLKAIAAKHGLDEPPAEVATLISHATEERLKTLIEKLSVIAEHRLDVIRMDDRYEITQDTKGQLRFLEELEKLERKRHDEQEREMLIKAAKSRSKSEDPEQAKLKAKAKEMQRVALEEMRHREANQTALQAIGPWKKPKLDIQQSGSQSTMSQNPLGGFGASVSSRPQTMRPRLKRVNARDLLFLLEQEKETSKSQFLYKNLLK